MVSDWMFWSAPESDCCVLTCTREPHQRGKYFDSKEQNTAYVKAPYGIYTNLSTMVLNTFLLQSWMFGQKNPQVQNSQWSEEKSRRLTWQHPQKHAGVLGWFTIMHADMQFGMFLTKGAKCKVVSVLVYYFSPVNLFNEPEWCFRNSDHVCKLVELKSCY